ncbi:MAG: hypothetical protein RR416_06100, partial [Clostridia bacterium]
NLKECDDADIAKNVEKLHSKQEIFVADASPVQELAKLFSASSKHFKFIFPSTKEVLAKLVQETIAEIDTARKAQSENIYALFYPQIIKKEPAEYARYNYLPPPLFSESSCSAKMRFVCTPFEAEFDFALSAMSRSQELKIVRYRLDVELAQRDDFEKNLKNILEDSDDATNVFAFFGLMKFKNVDKRKCILKTIASAIANKKGYALFHDNTGNKMLYCEFNDNNIERSLTAVNAYLTMPNYKDVIALLEELDNQKFDDYDFVMKNGVFVGYIGLNKVINGFVSGDKKWRRIMENISSENQNFDIVKKYIAKLTRIGQLIDGDWNTQFDVDNNANKKPFDYNYDEIRNIVDENIVEIIRADQLNIYEKCGILVRYCLLGGDDMSLWEGLDVCEKTARITKAVHALSWILDVEYKNPKVTLHDKMHSSMAGACCVDGGQEIQFKGPSINNFEWLVGAIAHEMFHSFQHTLISSALQEWHTSELGIISERVDFWAQNFTKYIDLEKETEWAYTVQILEADTVIFENLCKKAGASWYKIK